MIGKIFVVFVVLIGLILSFFLFYQNIPHDPVALKASEVKPEPVGVINYGAVPVFSENLRFNHNMISYFIDDECTDVRKKAMIRAFVLFANKMKVVSFYEVNANADIDVGCSDDYIPIDDRLFAAGEGGPSRIINTSIFKTIEKGKISLYNDPRCDYPIVEVHELGHVFGFDHSPDPNNIMYNVSDCDQKISDDMVKLINDLYSIEPLPDASIKDVKAIKKGRYLDFNITILNEGLIGIDAISLTIVADGEDVQEVELGEIGIGYGRTLKVTNVKLPSVNVDTIDFVIDKYEDVSELSDDNNIVQMIVSSQ
jgi:hypothetical protein